MITSLVTDANRDAIFSRVARRGIAKEILEFKLTSQSERAFNAIHRFSVY